LRKYKAALINPGKNKQFSMQEPLNIGFIAGFLEKHGVETKIIDELAGADVKKEVVKFMPDVVGITATTPLAEIAYQHADMCRKLGLKTVMGGVHASVMPEEALEHADIVVKGEGEQAMLDIILNDITQGIISRPYYKNIDEIPRPAYHLMDMDFYLTTRDRVPYSTSLFFAPARSKVASLLTSRGCPHSCNFCHNSWKGMPYRNNSPERVAEDVKYLIDTYHIDALFFCDDNLFANRPSLKKICSLMEERRINIAWGCNARADSVDPDTLRHAKKAGCRQITFGFESGSQKILDRLDKKTTVETNKKAVELCKEAGLLCVSTFMLGNPDETAEDVELTRKFILENDIDCIGLCITTPYPGTELWRWCQERRFIPENIKWSDFVADVSPIQVSQYLKPELVKKYRGKIYLEFALKKRHFVDLLKVSLRHPLKTIKKVSSTFRHLWFSS